MNIAIISPGPFSVPPVKGSSVEHDIDEVSRMIGAEHQVTIYTRTCAQYPDSTMEDNRQYIRIPYRSSGVYVQRVIKHLRKSEADLILVENRPGYVLSLRKNFPKTAIVLNMHSHVYASKSMIHPQAMKQVSETVDALLTNSHYLRQYFIQDHRFPAGKVHAVHLGIHTGPYQIPHTDQTVKALRSEHGIKKRDRVLLFAGRLMEEKGVHLLLQAFLKISEEDERARLLIIGGTGYGTNERTDYVKHLYQLANPIEPKVQFIDFIPIKIMPLWYQIADIVATPSVWGEPFCRVNLEAIASSKPVMTSTRGGIPEVVTDQSQGFLIAPDQWIEQAPELWKAYWRKKRLRKKMKKNTLERAKQFSWKATADGYLRVFEEVVALRAGGKDRGEVEDQPKGE